MRVFKLLYAVVLSVLIGCSALIYAQEPSQREEPQVEKQDAKPSTQEEAKPSKEEKKAQKQDEKKSQGRMKSEGQERLNQPADHAHQAQAQPERAGKGKGGHIPDDKFRAQFGRSHTFRATQVIVRGRPQFQYGGYNFELVDAWPAGWAYTDECYIDYIDGEYFLIDLLHPGMQIAVIVVM